MKWLYGFMVIMVVWLALLQIPREEVNPFYGVPVSDVPRRITCMVSDGDRYYISVMEHENFSLDYLEPDMPEICDLISRMHDTLMRNTKL